MESSVTWAEGTVRDEHGAPIEGATVFAVASDLYGARFRSNVNKTTTDANGHYSIKGEGNLEMFSATLVAWKEGWTDHPLIIASLPGRLGATIVDPPADPHRGLSITLPPPSHINGTITIGSKELDGSPGRIRILAKFQGKGFTGDALDVWAVPQADDTFALPGVTPGEYLVQADLDEIWLSASVRVKTTPLGMVLIKLDIPIPGAPVRVNCMDAAGSPIAGARIIVDRPSGPLTSLDWPVDFTVDGAGQALIPTLEAGIQAIKFADGSASVAATILPLPSGDLTVQLRSVGRGIK